MTKHTHNERLQILENRKQKTGSLGALDFLISLEKKQANQKKIESKAKITRHTSKTDKASKLKHLIFVWSDLSTTGGITTRTTTVINYGQKRKYKYIGLSARAATKKNIENVICHELDPTHTKSCLDQWKSSDSVVFVSNNALRTFPKHIATELMKLPLVYISAAQMAFMLQDSKILHEIYYTKKLKAMRIISFSEKDINFQQQLGIFGQVKVRPPVPQRKINTYNLNKNTELTYVGRIDFQAKDCMKLIALAEYMKENKIKGYIKIYTTDQDNSPNYPEFIEKINNLNLKNYFKIRLNISNKEIIYHKISFLLLPSLKESFGNVVVEALSYGVPAIVTSYAPGPSEIIEDRVSGFVLDNFNPKRIFDLLRNISPKERLEMSRNAFQRHRKYGVDQHLDQLENIAQEALREFKGENIYPIFPELKLLTP